MILSRLSIVNFKNIAQADLSFSPNINCFLGNNGMGKSNLLDAIYYLSFCKSYTRNPDSQNIRHGEDFFVVQGYYERNGNEEELYCGIKRRQKKAFKRNKKEYDRLSDHIGFAPLVMAAPSDNELILGGSEERRKFIDLVISQFDKQYLSTLIRYNKALEQRNSQQPRPFSAIVYSRIPAVLQRNFIAKRIGRSHLQIPSFRGRTAAATESQPPQRPNTGIYFPRHTSGRHGHDAGRVSHETHRLARTMQDLPDRLETGPIRFFAGTRRYHAYLVARRYFRQARCRARKTNREIGFVGSFRANIHYRHKPEVFGRNHTFHRVAIQHFLRRSGRS